MKWTLVRVRLCQARKQLNSLGMFYSLLLFSFLCFAIFYIFLAYGQKDKSLYVFSATILVFIGIHFSRSDREFVHNHIADPVQNIFSEYFIFSLPFTLPSLFTAHWFYFPSLIFSAYLIAHIKVSFKRRTLFPHLSKIIPSQNFEWLGGLRKNLTPVIILWLLAIISCRIRILPLVFLWFIVVTVTSFYQQCEPLQILYASAETPKKLVMQKIAKHTALILIIFFPVLVVNSIFNPDLLLINLIFLLVQITVLIFSILLKYTTYIPNENLKGNTILLSTVTIGALIPFLLPIPIIMCFRNYGRSVKNLNHYFNDPH
jgi:hypothetical protein